MEHLSQKIEALLYLSPRPLTVRQLGQMTGAESVDVSQVLESLRAEYEEHQAGVRLVVADGQAQLVTAPEAKEVAEAFLKEELTSELSKPSLETLTIIAYRGPVTKTEIETIRGVNCSLILRNLQMRGLVESVSGPKDEARYHVTIDFLRHLGLSAVTELPDYEQLNNDDNLQKLLLTNIVPATMPETESTAPTADVI